MNAHTRRDDVSATRRSTSRFTALIAAAIALLVFTVVPTAGAEEGGGGGGGRGGGGGQIHLDCAYHHSATDDPIVFPNMPGASHLHDFFGNVSTSARSTLQTMQQSGTTCHFAADRSGYWSPALISPSGQIVRPTFVAAYYLAGNGPVVAFPANLRMIAGAVSGSGGMTDLTKFGYNCGEQGPNTSTSPPNCTGRGSVRANITFPSCWDGRNIDSADHRSHVAYPRGGSRCPTGWRLIPKIVLHIRYSVVNGTGYTLSSDAGMGYRSGMSVHADFWNVWDQTILTQLVTTCLNAGTQCDL